MKPHLLLQVRQHLRHGKLRAHPHISFGSPPRVAKYATDRDKRLNTARKGEIRRIVYPGTPAEGPSGRSQSQAVAMSPYYASDDDTTPRLSSTTQRLRIHRDLC